MSVFSKDMRSLDYHGSISNKHDHSRPSLTKLLSPQNIAGLCHAFATLRSQFHFLWGCLLNPLICSHFQCQSWNWTTKWRPVQGVFHFHLREWFQSESTSSNRCSTLFSGILVTIHKTIHDISNNQELRINDKYS